MSKTSDTRLEEKAKQIIWDYNTACNGGNEDKAFDDAVRAISAEVNKAYKRGYKKGYEDGIDNRPSTSTNRGYPGYYTTA
jgi:hypothetical protein